MSSHPDSGPERAASRPAVASRRAVVALASLFGAVLGRAARAAAPAGADPAGAGGANSFAEHHLALQLSDAEPAKQKLLLSVANNMLRSFSPDIISIEVVTFGPGIALLHADSPLRDRVESLVAQGVRFDVCMNTVNTAERETGRKLALLPDARPVPAGVAQLIILAEQKYVVIRP